MRLTAALSSAPDTNNAVNHKVTAMKDDAWIGQHQQPVHAGRSCRLTHGRKLFAQPTCPSAASACKCSAQLQPQPCPKHLGSCHSCPQLPDLVYACTHGRNCVLALGLYADDLSGL